MPGACRDEIGPADDDAGLRAAEQLVSGEHDEVRAGGEGLSCCRLVAQPGRRSVGQPRAGRVEQPGAEVDDQRRRGRSTEPASSSTLTSLVNPSMR